MVFSPSGERNTFFSGYMVFSPSGGRNMVFGPSGERDMCWSVW